MQFENEDKNLRKIRLSLFHTCDRARGPPSLVHTSPHPGLILREGLSSLYKPSHFYWT